MPELPEVETVRRQLKPYILEKEIEKVEVFTQKIINYDKNFAHLLQGLQFIKIDRVGKLLIFLTSEADTVLLVHLKMTGKLIYFENENVEYKDKHTHVVFHFSDGSVLTYSDIRKFGYVKRVDPEELKSTKEKYGIEPSTDRFTEDNFAKIFKKRKTPLKALLIDQKAIAGLGNIYVDEVCFRAGVRPSRRTNKVTKEERRKLFKACQEVLDEAIKYGGTTFMNFSDAQNKSGNYSEHLYVFGREGDRCYRCGSTIKKVRVSGRGTYYCPACQK
ncbi:MAG: bifunctional DNA-formamidopyrimidine glycosylase/DNA-(apurinic or apyrimidinic site) lyase [Candidatus Campbellbacteria bacterium]|nr:bifunctional DNA-formamidopyrimidine glycosylase/DNA-(apurinic or apyrimidinic site) lyase [Candidatus Campbellbacteria bacterium]